MRIFEVIQSLKIHVDKPSNLDPQLQDQMIDLILAGGANLPDKIREVFLQSPIIAWAESNGQLAGVKMIKLPRPDYKQEIFAAAGVPELADKYKYELGYAVVAPEFRNQRISTQMSDKLMPMVNSPMFATVKKDYPSTLHHYGFKPLGEFPSSRGNYNIVLFGN